MENLLSNSKLRFYTVSPSGTKSFGQNDWLSHSYYKNLLEEHARIADNNGFYGMVFYCFNSALDPWICASQVLNRTKYISPLIAVQPYHYHPYVLAKKIASLTYLYGRQIDLNVVSGFSKKELLNIGDNIDDSRMTQRLGEYLSATRVLLEGGGSYSGDFYQINDMPISPKIPSELMPNLLVPGGSHSSVAKVIRERADSSLLMAKPLMEMKADLLQVSVERTPVHHGMIIGIVAREDKASAWHFARSEYAGKRKDKIASRMMVSGTRSYQHKYLIAAAEKQELYDNCLWYGGSRIGIDCPKLVGSYQEVRAGLEEYISLGVTDIIIDLPNDIGEYDHIFKVLGC